MMTFQKPPPKRQAGFTLMEVLLAAGLATVVITGAIALVNTSTKEWTVSVSDGSQVANLGRSIDVLKQGIEERNTLAFKKADAESLTVLQFDGSAKYRVKTLTKDTLTLDNIPAGSNPIPIGGSGLLVFETGHAIYLDNITGSAQSGDEVEVKIPTCEAVLDDASEAYYVPVRQLEYAFGSKLGSDFNASSLYTRVTDSLNRYADYEEVAADISSLRFSYLYSTPSGKTAWNPTRAAGFNGDYPQNVLVKGGEVYKLDHVGLTIGGQNVLDQDVKRSFRAALTLGFTDLPINDLHGCEYTGKPKPTENNGTLAVNITGLPAFVSGKVTVEGPEGFVDTASKTRYWDNLKPGTYKITASRVVQDALRAYRAEDFESGVNVTVARYNPTKVNVNYKLEKAKLNFNITHPDSFPPGVQANVQVAGLTSYTVEQFGVSSIEVDPGSYRIRVFDVQDLPVSPPQHYYGIQSLSASGDQYGQIVQAASGTTADVTIPYEELTGMLNIFYDDQGRTDGYQTAVMSLSQDGQVVKQISGIAKGFPDQSLAAGAYLVTVKSQSGHPIDDVKPSDALLVLPRATANLVVRAPKYSPPGGGGGGGGGGYHLTVSGSGQCPGEGQCGPNEPASCGEGSLGSTSRTYSPNGHWDPDKMMIVTDGTYSWEDKQCVWGSSQQYTVDYYEVIKGGEPFKCPIAGTGPFSSKTPIWTPGGYSGNPDPVYCDR